MVVAFRGFTTRQRVASMNPGEGRPSSRRLATADRGEESSSSPRLSTPPPQSEADMFVADHWCDTHVKVIVMTYMWTISNFSFFLDDTGEAIKSSTFSARAKDNFKWCLCIRPNGMDEESKDYLSVHLLLVSSNKSELHAKFKFSIVNVNQEATNIMESRGAFPFHPGKDWGFRKFIPRATLFDNAYGLLPDDTLTIFCELQVLESVINIPGQNNIDQFKVPECRLSDDFRNLFESRDKFGDVIMNANGREFYAHKAILSARSSVFAAMFEQDMGENKLSRVEVLDMDPEALHEMLRFIYTGQTPNLDSMADVLLAAADKYALERLKIMCEKALHLKLSAETATEVLILADAHNALHLKECAIDFITKYPTDVMEELDWKTMIHRQPHLVAEIFEALAAQLPVPIEGISANA